MTSSYHQLVQQELRDIGASAMTCNAFAPATYFTAWCKKEGISPREAAEAIKRCDDDHAPRERLDWVYEGVSIGSSR